MQLPQLLITILIALGIPLGPDGQLPPVASTVYAQVTIDPSPSPSPSVLPFPTPTPSPSPSPTPTPAPPSPTPSPTPTPSPKPPKDASCSGKLNKHDNDANFWGKFSSWWHKDRHDNDNRGRENHGRGNRGRDGGRR